MSRGPDETGRNRAPHLTELDRARQIVIEHSGRLGREEVALEDGLGRVLASDVISDGAVPGFENSAMDGYALRSGDTADASGSAVVALGVVGESRAGHPATVSVRSGEALAISTGAMLPAGADAVVPFEDVRVGDCEIGLSAPVAPGSYVRGVGEDIRSGSQVLAQGSAIGAFELGVLASIGRGRIPVIRRPGLRLLTTGDELIDAHGPMRPGMVRDTSSHVIPALARLAGAEILSTSYVGDDRAATAEAVAHTLDCDVAVICGGVSVGVRDHVRGALQAAGVREAFWGVALRPGKPTWFGWLERAERASTTLVFGLPGNPVSAVVTFLLFVRPAIRAMSGATATADRLRAVIDEDYDKQPGRAHAVRCALDRREDGWHVRPTGAQGSHVLTSMLGAQCLAIIPAPSLGVTAGEQVDVELLPPMQ